jgi:hypothetical protein
VAVVRYRPDAILHSWSAQGELSKALELSREELDWPSPAINARSECLSITIRHLDHLDLALQVAASPVLVVQECGEEFRSVDTQPLLDQLSKDRYVATDGRFEVMFR